MAIDNRKISEEEAEAIVQFVLKKHPGSPEHPIRSMIFQWVEMANFDSSNVKLQTVRMGALKNLGDAMEIVRQPSKDDGRREGTSFGWRIAKGASEEMGAASGAPSSSVARKNGKEALGSCDCKPGGKCPHQTCPTCKEGGLCPYHGKT